MLLDVPFIPAEQYVQFLNKHIASINSLYFSLFSDQALDARYKSNLWNSQDLLNTLTALEGPKKYALLNSRFYNAKNYFNPEAVNGLLQKLALLLERKCLDGIIYADNYLLFTLSKASPYIASQLEAVPSVNCMADSMDKVVSLLDAISYTHFKQPSKFTLDRSLNRKIDTLSDIAAKCRAAYPGMKLSLLANEGCLYQCPFKFAHDSHIALANTGVAADRTFTMNSEMGCIHILQETPHVLFKSPLIRPEDAKKYDAIVDVLKICGRTLGHEFLQNTVSSYIRESYSGNLLELTDTMSWLAERLYVANKDLPNDFFDTVTSCSKNCSACSYCHTLFKKHSHALPLTIKDLRA